MPSSDKITSIFLYFLISAFAAITLSFETKTGIRVRFWIKMGSSPTSSVLLFGLTSAAPITLEPYPLVTIPG